MMEAMFVALWALAGLVVGSFLNVAIYRLPRGEKLVAPLRCPKCGERQPTYALSTLFIAVIRAKQRVINKFLGTPQTPPAPLSLWGRGWGWGPYLAPWTRSELSQTNARVLRGSCAHCGAGIDRTGLLVELVTAGAFGILLLRYGGQPYTFLYSIYTSILIVIFFIDSRHRLILNRVTYPSILAALLLTPALTSAGHADALLGAAFGGLIFGLVYAAGHLIYRRAAMALGDVKLAVALGAMVGFPNVVAALLFGTLIGGAISLAVLATGHGSRRDFTPYGPALCLGTYISFFVDIVGA